MAPRRNNSGHSALDVHNLLGLEPDALDANHNQQSGLGDNLTRCCVPTGDCFKLGTLEFGLINLDDLRECIRVICNNENCTAGQYMHRECFDAWEEGVLTYLKTIGRARSWSDRQRQQNLWTKKGYDLVFKACGCKCGRGHLKKDLDWLPPTVNNIIGGHSDEDNNKKKKKKNRNNQKPTLTLTTNNFHANGTITTTTTAATNGCGLGNTGNNNVGIIGVMNSNGTGNNSLNDIRDRTASLSSGTDGCSSPPVSASSEMSISPIHNSTAALLKRQKSRVEAYSERIR